MKFFKPEGLKGFNCFIW